MVTQSSYSLACCVAVVGLLAAPFPVMARDQIRTYDIPKETQPVSRMPVGHPPTGDASQADPHAGMTMGDLPKARWEQIPHGWKLSDDPGAMRAATFYLMATNEEIQGEVAIIPVDAGADMDLQLVNMWRSQLGLTPLNDADRTNLSSEVVVGKLKGRLFDMVSKEPVIDETKYARILVVTTTDIGKTWFIRVSGEDSVVDHQRPALIDFLKGLSFEPAPPSQMPAGHPPMMGQRPGGMGGGDTVPPGTTPHPDWVVPSGWQEVAHSPFITAKFRVAGEDGAKADINVSMSAGGGGGLLPNVNRWRGQLSLAPLDPAGLEKICSTLDLPSGKATLVDMSGSESENDTKARCIGVMVPLQGEVWFYKLMGTDTIVGREKDAFLQFIRSVKYPHEH
jgi:hypothetical protein